MKRRKKYGMIFLIGVLSLCILTACQKTEEAPVSTQVQPGEVEKEQAEMPENQEKVSEQEDENKITEEILPEDRVIKEQTFETELHPLGNVKFVSCRPDTEKNPLADVEFSIWKDGKKVCELPGIFEENIRSNEEFEAVEAVSFPDYDKDGYEDILVICSYSPVSGPDEGTGYSEVRIYHGQEDGSFALERKLSEDANSALAEKTIQSVKGFLGMGQSVNTAVQDSWQQAYIDYINEADQEGVRTYVLIYLDDDDIPELVDIGTCEAEGCRIVNYSDGKAWETQLRRLYFNYLERENLLCNSEGNMDSYTDLVFRIQNGRMELVASGAYGAEDNSDVQFDAEGNPIYQYEWNGVSMTKEEYEKALNEVYDPSRAKDGYVWGDWYSKEEMIEKLENWL